MLAKPLMLKTVALIYVDNINEPHHKNDIKFPRVGWVPAPIKYL